MVWIAGALVVAVFFLFARRAACGGGSQAGPPSAFIPVLRDWVPAALIPLAYREAGLLVVPDRTHFWDLLFEGWDRALLSGRAIRAILTVSSPWLGRYLELSYLFCYPLVPLGLLSVYVLHRRRAAKATPESPEPSKGGRAFDLAADRFWTTVLLGVLTAYALFPLFPSITPRELFHDLPAAGSSPLLRRLNLAILGQYGIAVGVFPSGHVAGVTATALAVFDESRRAGVIFILAAASIAAATIYGRYHYTADAVAGAAVALVMHWVSRRLHAA